jgi:hypothetical protein
MFKHYAHRGDYTFGMSGSKRSWFVFVKKNDQWVEKMAVETREEARGLFDIWLNQYVNQYGESK